ncbi:MAG TPA: TnsA endonuclease C-terminal domain-containing protein [Azospirillaceae bacterium]|nr:TnsA endonuclease C-terminal domain-containing protein [Azospirillaceae bacterium]
MARRRYAFDEDKIARFLKEGRGQGHGAAYRPWLTVQDVPSIGRVHRLRGLKTGRQHHLLSDIECHLFLLLDWMPLVRDIREQFPLDRAATQRIAERLGFRHPCDTATKTPLVMTTDIVVDTIRNDRLVTLARTVKPADELDKSRVVEKLEIERQYWAERGIDWGIVTERDLPKTIINNIKWVHSYAFLDDLSQPYDGYIAEKADLLLGELVSKPGGLTLQRFCADMDARLALEAGRSLMLVRHLLARKVITCDMAEPVDDTVPISRFQVAGGIDLARASP